MGLCPVQAWRSPASAPDCGVLSATAKNGRGGMSFQPLHTVENRGDYVLVPNHRVDHQVIETACRPVGIEVVLDVCHPLLVHILHQVFGVFLTLSHRSEEHTSELQSLRHLVCRLLL